VAEVTQVILARDGRVQTGELAVPAALVLLAQLGTEAGLINVLIHLGGYLQKDETGGVIAVAASGAVSGRTERAGEAQVHRGTDKPTEAAFDVALLGQCQRPGRKAIMRQPAAGVRGEGREKGLAVMLVEGLGMGDKGVEVKGRALLVSKREDGSAQGAFGDSYVPQVTPL